MEEVSYHSGGFDLAFEMEWIGFLVALPLFVFSIGIIEVYYIVVAMTCRVW